MGHYSKECRSGAARNPQNFVAAPLQTQLEVWKPAGEPIGGLGGFGKAGGKAPGAPRVVHPRATKGGKATR